MEIDREKCIARVIDDDLINDIYSWMSNKERKEVFIFLFSKMKTINIQEYI